MTPCQPRTPRSGRKSWPCSAISSASPTCVARPPRDLAVEVDVAVAADHVRDVDAPAVEAERRGSGGARRAKRARSSSLRQSSFGSVGMPSHDSYPCGIDVVEDVEAALGRARIGLRALEPLVPVARVVQGDVADHADAARVRRRAQRARAPRRRRAAGRRGRTSSRRSGGSTSPGRTASGRSRFAPSDSMWSRCCSTPRRSPP